VPDDFKPFGRSSKALLLTEEDAKLLSGKPVPLTVKVPVSIHDDPKQVELRKGQGDPLIMYLVVRESLGMSAGKIGAQCGHATDMILLKYLREGGVLPPEDGQAPFPKEETEDTYFGDSLIEAMVQARMERHKLYYDWLQTSFRKVVLTADDKEWSKVQHAGQDGLSFVIVRDAGLTEVASGSETVMGIWPMYKSLAPKVIKKLQVLK
jgi:peptidyl-tRNA hydrolase